MKTLELDRVDKRGRRTTLMFSMTVKDDEGVYIREPIIGPYRETWRTGRRIISRRMYNVTREADQ